MAKKQYFENLLGAMQESILKAHSMIENQHLNVMKRYFDESQKPLTLISNILVSILTQANWNMYWCRCRKLRWYR